MACIRSGVGIPLAPPIHVSTGHRPGRRLVGAPTFFCLPVCLRLSVSLLPRLQAVLRLSTLLAWAEFWRLVWVLLTRKVLVAGTSSGAVVGASMKVATGRYGAGCDIKDGYGGDGIRFVVRRSLRRPAAVRVRPLAAVTIRSRSAPWPRSRGDGQGLLVALAPRTRRPTRCASAVIRSPYLGHRPRSREVTITASADFAARWVRSPIAW